MTWERLFLTGGPNSLSSTIYANKSDTSSSTVCTCAICCCCCGCSSLPLVTTIFNVFNGSSNGGSAYSLCFTFAINLSSSLTSSSSSVSSSNDEDICLHFLVLQQQVLLWCYFITVSKFSLNPQPQSIPFPWVFRLISPGLIDVISIRTTYCYPQNVHSPLLIYSLSGLQIACSMFRVFCLFPKSGSSNTKDRDVFLTIDSRYRLKELSKVLSVSPKSRFPACWFFSFC